MSTYAEKLKDPRWQRRRLEVLSRDGWACQACARTDRTLHVHHRWYLEERDPWDYPDKALVTVCEECHQAERTDRPDIEGKLLLHLRRALMVHDLENFVEAIRSMSDEWLLATADTQKDPTAWAIVDCFVLDRLEGWGIYRGPQTVVGAVHDAEEPAAL